MVQIHLYSLTAYLKHDSRNDSTCAVQHRYRVARHKQVLANLSVHLESSLGKIDYPVLIHLAITVGRGESYIETVTRLHALDMLLQFRKQTAGSVNIVQRMLLCGMIDDFPFDFKFIAELNYCVFPDFHIYINFVTV